MIPAEKWKWFGNSGHFICGDDCRFHLCTLVGDVLVSTIGEFFPDSPVREIIAQSRGIILKGKGDERKADYMKRIGFEEVGCGRKYETMAFKTTGKECSCGCGLPGIISETEFGSYNAAKEATKGHFQICLKIATGELDVTKPISFGELGERKLDLE